MTTTGTIFLQSFLMAANAAMNMKNDEWVDGSKVARGWFVPVFVSVLVVILIVSIVLSLEVQKMDDIEGEERCFTTSLQENNYCRTQRDWGD